MPALPRRLTPRDEQFFDVARAEGRRHIPADTGEPDLCGEMGPCKAHCHGYAPSLFIVDGMGEHILESRK